jgi:hypothetical protein
MHQNEKQKQITRAVILLLLTGLAFTVEARIGDTKDQAAARYGKPLKCEQEEGVEGCSHNSGRFFVKCWYLDGVVGALMVRTVDDTPFSQDEIDVIRNANSGGSSWKEKPAELSQRREYERADGKAWITIIKGNYLFIESVQFSRRKERDVKVLRRDRGGRSRAVFASVG